MVNSICILRLSAIGDVTHALPVVATLQNRFPDAKITWVIGKIEYKLMKGLKGVEFVLFDKSKGSKGYKEVKKQLDDKTFDVLLQMQYSFRANRLAWKIKAKQRIGFDKKRSREFHSYKLTHRIAAVEKQHVLDSFMEFTKVLGVTKNEFIYQWNIETEADDQKFVNQYIQKDRKNVIISPCSSKKTRNWSVENYAKIADYLVEKYQAHVIICGSPSPYEIEIAGKIEALCINPVTNIAGKDTLKQLYLMMMSADLVISPDSGPIHISNAAGTPVIGLHIATIAKRSGAYNYPNLAIDVFEQAAGLVGKNPEKIRWGGQIDHPDAMNLITQEMVREKVDLVLGK